MLAPPCYSAPAFVHEPAWKMSTRGKLRLNKDPRSPIEFNEFLGAAEVQTLTLAPTTHMYGFLDISSITNTAITPNVGAPCNFQTMDNPTRPSLSVQKLALFSAARPADYTSHPLPRTISTAIRSTSDNVPALQNETSRPAFSILKFGGTSVAKHLSSIVDDITSSCRSQNVSKQRIPILVCSAQSYTVKAEGTTQCLLAAIDAALQPPRPPSDIGRVRDIDFASKPVYAKPMTPPPTPPQYECPMLDSKIVPSPSSRTIVEGVLQRHCEGARRVILRQDANDDLSDTITKEAILAHLEEELRMDCGRVIRLLAAVETLREITPRTRDAVVSVGELMACRTAVAVFHSRGIAARLLNLTDLNFSRRSGTFSEAVPLDGVPFDQTYFDKIVESIRDHVLEACAVGPDEETPVLVATGFFGPVPGSLLDLIGRGYTDVCAALCARAVAADELQIWKEVDGVFSADPRKIASARLLPEISSDHAKLLTSYGSEVIHSRAIDQASTSKIPIVIKNVANPNGAGTRVVMNSAGGVGTRLQPRAKRSSSGPLTFAVTVLDHLEMVRARFDDWDPSSNSHPISVVSDIMKQHLSAGLGMDLITSSLADISFVLGAAIPQNPERESDRHKALKELRRVASVTISAEMSYLQVVFSCCEERSHSVPSEILTALAGAKIAVKMISYGPTGFGMGFVISSPEASRASAVVHDVLLRISQ